MRAHALRRRLPHADGLSRPNPCAAQTLNTVGVVSGCARPIEGRAGARRNGRASGAPWGRSRGGRRPVRCTCTRRTVVGCDQGACASDPAPGGTGEAEVAAWRAEAGRTACRNPPKPDTPIGHPVRRPPRGPTVDPHTGSANRTNEHPSVDRPEQQGARQLQHTGPWAPSTGRTTARTTRALRGGGAVAVPLVRPAMGQGAGPGYKLQFDGIEIAWSSVCLLVPPSGRPLDAIERTGTCGAVCALGRRGPRSNPPVFPDPGRASDRRPPAVAFRRDACSTWNTPGLCGGVCFTWNIPGPQLIHPADQLLTSGYAADRGRPSAIAPAPPLGPCAHVIQAGSSVSGAEWIRPSVTLRA
jgi:hypothetical protein